jgi:DNA-directed RNA polymerase subunit alpha
MANEINLPQNPQIIHQKDNITDIQIDGCYPGYGMTLANALRRVLLSSLPGSAIIAFKIKGVDHEFSTIPNVLEDVIKISLNLKKVCFSSKKLLSDEQLKATIKEKGEKKITAADIKTPAGLEVANPNLHIATLTDKKANLEIELFITGGYGYERAEDRRQEKLSIGTIALDAIYSPVIKASYEIEDMRIGERTDFNRIIFHIETDGSLEGKEALQQASQILSDHFAHLAKIQKKFKKSAPAKKEKTVKETKSKEMPKKISDLQLDTKTINVLTKNGIKSIAGLTNRKQESLRQFDGIGKKTISDINKALKKFNLSLK